MLETSQDLLFVVLTVCVVFLTIFLCLALFYLIKLLKQTNETVTEVKEKIAQVTNVFSLLKTSALTSVIKKVVEFAKNLMQNKTTKNKNKK